MPVISSHLFFDNHMCHALLIAFCMNLFTLFLVITKNIWDSWFSVFHSDQILLFFLTMLTTDPLSSSISENPGDFYLYFPYSPPFLPYFSCILPLLFLWIFVFFIRSRQENHYRHEKKIKIFLFMVSTE